MSYFVSYSYQALCYISPVPTELLQLKVAHANSNGSTGANQHSSLKGTGYFLQSGDGVSCSHYFILAGKGSDVDMDKNNATCTTRYSTTPTLPPG